MDTILRIENINEKGIYRGSFSMAHEISDIGGVHPNIFERDSDTMYAMAHHAQVDDFHLVGGPWSRNPFHDYHELKDFRFGFKDAEQLKQWVFKDDWIIALQLEGYKAVTYTGTIFHSELSYQSVVWWPTRQRILTQELLDLF